MDVVRMPRPGYENVPSILERSDPREGLLAGLVGESTYGLLKADRTSVRE